MKPPFTAITLCVATLLSAATHAAAQTTTPAADPLAGPAAAPPPVPGDWQLIWRDEFDGDTLDDTKWSTGYPWGRIHNHRAYCAPENVRVSNGRLLITAERRRHPDAPRVSVHNENRHSLDYTSGVVTTANKFSFTHGYLEGRFRIPAATGTWPAFWTLNTEGGWPPEIDVLEVPGEKTRLHFYYHYGEDYRDHQSFGRSVEVDDLSRGFHTYAVHWTPESMTFYLDGERKGSWRRPQAIAQAEDMYLLINLAVGGWAPDPEPGGRVLGVYACDWVRVWQLAPTDP